MSSAKLNKIKILLKQLKKAKPKTFYDELAEHGLLLEYLNRFRKEEFEKDIEFRNRMFDILAEKSPENLPEVEMHYLENLIESLSFFEEYTKK